MTDRERELRELPDDGSCFSCGGSRYEVTCPDDLCGGRGYCDCHDNLNRDCPYCNEDGEHDWII